MRLEIGLPPVQRVFFFKMKADFDEIFECVLFTLAWNLDFSPSLFYGSRPAGFLPFRIIESF